MSDKSMCYPYPGEYILGEIGSKVAVLIIGRGAVDVPSRLFKIKGIMKTENVGLEKVILNVISDPSIRFLVVCGKEEFGHFPADAIINLMKNGIGDDKRIIGARSAIPFLCSVPRYAIERFRSQVTLVDLVHPKDVDEIVAMDPIYQFDDERRRELIEELERLSEVKIEDFPYGPMNIEVRGLMQASDSIGKTMHRTADVIIEGFLRMPSEALNTRSGFAIVDEHFGIGIDPVGGSVFQSPNLELAGRMRMYFTGC
ncbi:MAG: hypothetical protein HPY73_01125 [Methanomassiliicoccales archaeon]|nr:MAG: hypothetical protein HPY73_01125 [Methanomassiliicoccales archaeon]